VFGEVISADKSNIDLVSTTVTGSIVNSFASCVIDQKFKNKSSKEESCTLRINGGMDFIVYNVKVIVGSKVMNFVLREIEEAKNGVAQAQNAGLKYGYGARSDDTSDALIFDIGNMPANSEFTVHIETSFVGKAENEKTLVFNLPHDKKFANSPLSLNINVKMEGIESVDDVTFTATENGGKITVDNKPVNMLTFHMKDPLESSAVSFKVGNDNYVGITMIPDIPDNIKPKSECIILIDCSGSMSGTPIRVAKEALEMFLRSLPFDSYFNVYRFGSDYRSFFDESVPYTKENLNIALEKTTTMKADLGGTNLLSPLKNIFEKKEKDGYVKQIFIITDGEVEEQSQILTLATKSRNTTRCFAVGIGNDVSRDFIEEFAKTTAGNPAFIRSSDQVSSVVMKQLTSAIKPAVTGVQVHSEGSEAIEVAPFPIPPLFVSQFTCIFMKNAAGGILVEGKAGEKEFEEALEPVESDIHIDKLFAFYNIRDLEESITIASEEEKEKIRQNVINQSLMNGIVSQFTAMCNVVGDEDSPQKVSRQQQAQEQEQDYHSFQFSQQLNTRQMRGQSSYFGTSYQQDFSLVQPKSCACAPVQDIPSVVPNLSLVQPKKKSGFRLFNWIGSLFSKKEKDDEYDCEFEPEPILMDDAPCLAQQSFASDSIDNSNEEEVVEEKATAPTSDIVCTLMTTQEFEGYWSNMEFIEKSANCKLELQGLSGNQLITVFALALLEENGDESIWLLIYNKALDWLNSQNSAFDWKKAIADARSKIKK